MDQFHLAPGHCIKFLSSSNNNNVLYFSECENWTRNYVLLKIYSFPPQTSLKI